MTPDIIRKKRNDISDLMEDLKKFPQVETPVTHRFAPGVYLREISMPAGSIVVGKIHATEHFNIIIAGKVSVYTVEGVEYYEAPATFVSGAGVQKVVVMHTDCQWQTVHVTNKTDLKEIEAEVIVESYDQLELDSLMQNALEGAA